MAVATFTVNDFIRKWHAVELKERSAAQEHFLDLCRLLDEPSPAEADPTGDFYCFERGATKASGGDGWADVWKRGCFGWEYKGKRKNLDAAFGQLQQYALAPENPPLLVVCDLDQFVIRTNWTNTVSEKHEFRNEDLREPRTLQKLKWVMSDPEKLLPGKTRQDLTEDAAAEFATLAQRLRERGHDSGKVAHFINRLVFCMFAEDVGLLPAKMFLRMLQAAKLTPDEFQKLASSLFGAMKDGGLIGFERIDWFNGGLFDDDQALPMTADDIALCLRAAALNWSEIDPSIFGTLFVRGLDPGKRSQTGAEYTDREKIMMIVEPVVMRPLLREWEVVRDGIKGLIEPASLAVEEALASASGYPELAEEVRAVESHLASRPQLELFGDLKKQKRVRGLDAVRGSLRAADRALADAIAEGRAAFNAFLARLRAFRVLDPACGSGNFLYLALVELKNIERRVAIEGELLGFPPSFPAIGPEALFGIEINPYAAELARISVWIGEIQWMRRSGFNIGRRPILKPLTNIECRDAILNADGAAATWPPADVIVGNPPFLGDRHHRNVLGEDYTLRIRAAYGDRVPGRADLVVYWLQKAAELAMSGSVQAFGLVATKAVTKGASRGPLDLLATDGRQLVYDAWTNEPWVVEGAAVRVCIICGCSPSASSLFSNYRRLNGASVDRINPDLTAGVDITRAARLQENAGLAFQGVKLTGPFDIGGEQVREMLRSPLNPNGRPNSDVISRLYDIEDVVGRDSDRWVVDFGIAFREREAALYEEPFKIILNMVVPFRNDPQKCRSTEARLKDKFWEFQRPRPEMRNALKGKSRFIVTPESSEHRVFIWVPRHVLIQGSLFCICSDSDVTFGVLSSRIHEVWSTAQGNRLGVGNQRRYNIGVTFETFPFPDGITPSGPLSEYQTNPSARAIGDAAQILEFVRKV